MKVSRLGEFGLIERLAKHQPKLPGTIVGIGDDCAVLQGKKTYLLLTTDALVEGVHFQRKGLSFFALGQKALAANISDIAAMGGWPTHALVTIGLPNNLSVKAVDDLYRGINKMARQNKIDIVGGDTVASPKALVISITLLGEVEKRNLVLRSTAKVGDLICVTGRFGGEAARNYELRITNDELRIKDARVIAKKRLATAMIDSSDGLVRSVLELCRASKVGARIFKAQVPIAPGATLDQALYGGEEYELVFTVNPGHWPEVKGLRYTVVGEIINRRSGIKLVDRHGKIRALRSGGYEHFSR
jgi:thiamine-monophosphate kinase